MGKTVVKSMSVGGCFRIVRVPGWKIEQKGCSNVLGRAQEACVDSQVSSKLVLVGKSSGSKVASLE